MDHAQAVVFRCCHDAPGVDAVQIVVVVIVVVVVSDVPPPHVERDSLSG